MADNPRDKLSSTRARHRATMSHWNPSTGKSTTDAIDGHGGALPSLPPPQRSPTPPGVPSKRGSSAVAARRASLPITPISPSDSSPATSMPLFASSPTTTLNNNLPTSLSTVGPDNLSRGTSYARSISHTKITAMAMEPVPEDTDTGEYAETRSLRQLPSPPASPEHVQSDARWRAAPTSSASSSSSASKRRPSLSGSARQSTSASGALPQFRPRSSTGPSVALPLTAAFQTSVLRSGSASGSGSLATGATTPPSAFAPHGHRYPSIMATSPPPPRSRPSSVSVSMSSSASRAAASPSSDPDDGMAYSTEALRRLSTTDIVRQRHHASSSHPYSNPLTQSSRAEGPERQSLLQTPTDALRMPPIHDAGIGGSLSRRSSHRNAAVYSPPPPSGGAAAAMGAGTGTGVLPCTLPTHLSPPALSPTNSPVLASTGPRLPAHAQSQSQSQSQPYARAPSTVNWKSLASGSRASISSTQQRSLMGDALPRSRSNSVRSVRTVPAHIPPLETVAPLSMGFRRPEDSDGEDESGRKKTKA